MTFSQVKADYLEPAIKGLDFLQKAPEEERVSKLAKVHPEYISMAKICLSLKDLYDLPKKTKTDSNAVNEYSCFFQSLQVLETSKELVLKSFIKKDVMANISIMV